MRKFTSVFMAMLILLFGAIVFFDKPLPVNEPRLLMEATDVEPSETMFANTLDPPVTATPTSTSTQIITPEVNEQLELIPVVTPIPITHPTPTPTPRIINYVLNSSIDLSSGLPVAMVIERGDGRVIKSNWALAIAYQEIDTSVFEARKGTIYSHVDGGYVATWAHSGRIGEVPLYGFELEKAVWINSSGQPVTLEEGTGLAESLIGSKMILCQASLQSEKKPFDVFDPEEACSGVKLEFVVTAATLIEREFVDEYENSTGHLIDWLLENKSGMGFENLQTRDGYLVQTCVGKYSDQKADGTPDYVFNRLVVGFTLVP